MRLRIALTMFVLAVLLVVSPGCGTKSVGTADNQPAATHGDPPVPEGDVALDEIVRGTSAPADRTDDATFAHGWGKDGRAVGDAVVTNGSKIRVSAPTEMAETATSADYSRAGSGAPGGGSGRGPGLDGVKLPAAERHAKPEYRAESTVTEPASTPPESHWADSRSSGERTVDRGFERERGRHAEEKRRPAADESSAETELADFARRRGNIQAGTLTAGSFDDHQNVEDFRQFVSETLQHDAHEIMPRLAIGRRVLIHVRNGQGQPVADARVQVTTAGNGWNSQGSTVLDLQTGTDGRTLLVTGRDGATTDRYLVTVTSPAGGAPVKQECSTETDAWAVVLPDAPADLPTRLDLALVIDTTGSMGDELEYLKTEIDDIASAVHRMFPNVDARFALVVYRDEGDQYVTRTFGFTASLSEFRSRLAAQRARGGGDYPEAMHVALEQAADLNWRDRQTARVMFLVGDAPPHDRFGSRALDAVDKLRQREVRIYPVAGSGVQVKAEFVLRSAAFLTLGQYLFLTDHSGVGGTHAAPHVPEYAVEHLNRLMLRMIASELAGRRLVAQEVIAIERGDLDPVDVEPAQIDPQQVSAIGSPREEEPSKAIAWMMSSWRQKPPAWLILLVSVVVLGVFEAILFGNRRRRDSFA